MIKEHDYFIDGVFREGLYLQAKESETKNHIGKCLTESEIKFLTTIDTTIDNDEVLI